MTPDGGTKIVAYGVMAFVIACLTIIGWMIFKAVN